MDSISGLNKHLPNPRKRKAHPPVELLQAFKAAAQSITSLYRSAAAAEIQARESGYREAVEDLVDYLDQKNLGLDDGEGWLIRKWATERLSGQNGDKSDSETERETEPVSSSAREQTEQSSPIRGQQRPRSVTRSTSPEKAHRARDSTEDSTTTTNALPATQFTFRTANPMPPPSTSSDDAASIHAHPRPTPRSKARHSHHRPQHARRDIWNSLGSGAGSKRKTHIWDGMFDIDSASGSLQNSPKRSRLQ